MLVFDEPLSNLDAALRVQTRLEIAKLHHDIGHASMIHVTHDQVEAMTLADKVVLLRVDGTSKSKAGERIALRLRATHCHLFDHTGKGFPRTVELPS